MNFYQKRRTTAALKQIHSGPASRTIGRIGSRRRSFAPEAFSLLLESGQDRNKRAMNFSFTNAEDTLKTDTPEAWAFTNDLLEEQLEYFTRDSRIFKKYTYNLVNIEICTHCTSRCLYCPVSAAPQPGRIMSNKLFATILKKIGVLKPFRVCLNHYNEPLLDPAFLGKAAILKERGIELVLFTNALLLSKTVIEGLVRLGNTSLVAVNLPSIEREEYARLTGIPITRNRLGETLKNIKFAAKKGLDVRILVNGAPGPARKNYTEIKKYFGTAKSSPGVSLNLSHDRAGSVLSAEVKKSRRTTGFLGGCNRAITSLSIDVSGKVFLCCQDYFKKNVFGDLTRQNLEDIIFSEKMISFKKNIFGYTLPDQEFICRSCIEIRKKRAAA